MLRRVARLELYYTYNSGRFSLKLIYSTTNKIRVTFQIVILRTGIFGRNFRAIKL